MKPLTHFLSTLLFLSLLTTISAADWPQFRGPTGDGQAGSQTFPTQWSATSNVRWKQAIPGSGWSSPVLRAGKVYLTTAVPIDGGEDVSLRALCLDADSSKLLWNVEVFRQDGKTAPNIHKKNSHASPTPIVTEDRLFVHFGHQGTACLDLNGKLVWSNRELGYAPVHGNGGSPILVDSLLVFSRDGAIVREVVALDATNGRVKWRTPRSGFAARRFSFSTPTLITLAGRQQIISPGSDMVGAYDPQTGKELWRVSYDGYSVIPKPLFAHGLLFVCTGYNTPSLLAIRPDGKDGPKVEWQHGKAVPHTPSLLLVGEELYLVSDNGFASCLDAKSGTVHWSRRIPGNGYSASPIFAGGHIYFLSEDGICTVIKPGKTYELVARNEIGERTLASPAAVDGSLFLRTSDHLYRIGK